MTEREIGQILAEIKALHDKFDTLVLPAINICSEKWDKHYKTHERINTELTRTKTILGFLQGLWAMLWAGLLAWWRW